MNNSFVIEISTKSLLKISIILFLAFFFINEAIADVSCASRPLLKPSLSEFRNDLMKQLNGTKLHGMIRRDSGTFNSTTQNYYANEFEPKDTICIIDGRVPKKSPKFDSILNTYSGTTVLLAPYQVNPRGSQYVGNSDIVASLASRYAHESTKENCYKHGFPDGYDEKCPERNSERGRNLYRELIREIGSNHRGVANKITSIVFSPEEPSNRSNLHAFESFVGAVSNLESINLAFYMDIDIKGATYKVKDTITDERRNAKSLLGFIGHVLAQSAESQIFARNVELYKEFNKSVVPHYLILKQESIGSGSIWDHPNKDALQQMFRGFICGEGGNSGVDPYLINSDTILFNYRNDTCTEYSWKGKIVVELSGSLDRDPILDDLELITAVDSKNQITKALTALQAINLDQSKILNEIHKYVATDSFDRRISETSTALAELKSQRTSDWGKVIGFGTAIASVSTGGAAFIGGLDNVNTLLKATPTKSLKVAASYFWENREAFSEAQKSVSDGAASLITGINLLEDVLDGGPSQHEIRNMEEKLNALISRKNIVLEEVDQTADRLETSWEAKVEELYQATLRERSLSKNIALIASHAMNQKLLASFGNENFYYDIKACSLAIQKYGNHVDSFNPVPINRHCGGGKQILLDIRQCVKTGFKDKMRLVAVESSNYLFILARNRKDPFCFGREFVLSPYIIPGNRNYR